MDSKWIQSCDRKLAWAMVVNQELLLLQPSAAALRPPEVRSQSEGWPSRSRRRAGAAIATASSTTTMTTTTIPAIAAITDSTPFFILFLSSLRNKKMCTQKHVAFQAGPGECRQQQTCMRRRVLQHRASDSPALFCNPCSAAPRITSRD